MNQSPTFVRRRSAAAVLLTALLLAVASSANASAAAASPGVVSLSEAQVATPVVGPISTAPTVGGVQIDPGTVKASSAGGAPRLSGSGVGDHVVGLDTSESPWVVVTSLANAGRRNVSVAGTGTGAGVAATFVSAAYTADVRTFESQVRVNLTHPPFNAGVQPLGVPANAVGKAFQNLALVDLGSASRPVPSASPTGSAVVASAAYPPQAMSKGLLGMGWLLWSALLFIFLGLAGVVVAVAMPTYVSRRRRRLMAIEGYVTGSGPGDERAQVRSISASLVNLGDKVMDSRASAPKTQRLLERADLPLRLGEWAVLQVVAVVVGMAGGVVLLHGGSVSMLVGACLGGVLGVISPKFFLKFAASLRAKKFERQLPDVLTLVASSLSTGFSLLQALDAVAKDAAEPSAKEFSRALAETRIGTDLNESLNHLADRMQSTNLRWTAMAISIQRQVGGNLGETLRNTAATLRDKESLKRHVNALSAEGKLSAYILIALPIGIFLYMLMVNRPYVELLWTSMIGIGMLSGGLVSLAIGVFWMRKVVVVEV